MGIYQKKHRVKARFDALLKKNCNTSVYTPPGHPQG